MTTAPTFAPGYVHHRWTVLRRATPEPRDGCVRPRVLCRCVCGHEQIIWVGDLQRGRTNGCRFAACRHRHEAKRALRLVLPAELVEQLLEVAEEQERPVHRLLSDALSGIPVPRARQHTHELQEAS